MTLKELLNLKGSGISVSVWYRINSWEARGFPLLSICSFVWVLNLVSVTKGRECEAEKTIIFDVRGRDRMLEKTGYL
jgi:hypothetical protein